MVHVGGEPVQGDESAGPLGRRRLVLEAAQAVGGAGHGVGEVTRPHVGAGPVDQQVDGFGPVGRQQVGGQVEELGGLGGVRRQQLACCRPQEHGVGRGAGGSDRGARHHVAADGGRSRAALDEHVDDPAVQHLQLGRRDGVEDGLAHQLVVEGRARPVGEHAVHDQSTEDATGGVVVDAGDLGQQVGGGGGTDDRGGPQQRDGGVVVQVEPVEQRLASPPPSTTAR